MKIAITGKGGVGKTTLSVLLSRLYAKGGRRVIAVDADPDANLLSAFGVKEDIIKKVRPIAQLTEVIAERTGAQPGSMGGVFKLNPRVDDIPDTYSHEVDGVRVMVMGKSKEASSGCYCPENVFLKRLLKHLVMEKGSVLIVDMEAGIEHMTRGTAEGVNAFIVVVEPGQRSIQTAYTVNELAKGLGVPHVFVVASKIRNRDDLAFIKSSIGSMELIGSISFSSDIMEADIKGMCPFDNAPVASEEVRSIKDVLESIVNR